MLAAPRDYLYPIHILSFAIMAIGWLWGGSWLLFRALEKREYPKKIKMGNCVLIMLLAGVCGVAAAGAILVLFKNIGQSDRAMLAIGAGIGLVALLVAAVLVIYAMLELSFGKAVKVAAVPLAVMVGLIAVVGTVSAVPAYIWRHAERKQGLCQVRMYYVYQGLLEYQQRYAKPSPDLKDLLDKNMVGPEMLVCPEREDLEIGFFYHPGRVVEPEEQSEKMLLCDLAGSHGDERNVLMANGQLRACDPDEFQTLLDLAGNKDFAEALRKSEGD